MSSILCSLKDYVTYVLSRANKIVKASRVLGEKIIFFDPVNLKKNIKHRQFVVAALFVSVQMWVPENII